MFEDLTPTAEEHFKIYFYAAVARVIEQAVQAFDSLEEMLAQFPFLSSYHEELVARGLIGVDDWEQQIAAWEGAMTEPLPVRNLCKVTALDHRAVTLLMGIGLIEEDARFGCLFDGLQSVSTQSRPTLGLLSAWWRAPENMNAVRVAFRQLLDLGLIQVCNPDAPRMEWALQPNLLLWDALRGERAEKPAAWLRYDESLPGAEAPQLILPSAVQEQLASLPPLLQSGEVRAVVVRGPQHNGRRTILRQLARATGRGVLEVSGLGKADDERWKVVGLLATLLNAMPVAAFDLAPGESCEVPEMRGYEGAVGIVVGKQGGVTGAGVENAITVTVAMPDVELRRQHWQAAFEKRAAEDLDEISERFRLTSGNLRRAAKIALSYAALDGRERISKPDIQRASRTLNRQMLDTLAEHIEATGDWSYLAVGAHTLSELYNLESRCRQRERLHRSAGLAFSGQGNVGVRALLSGPSGTGKTLAARLLAAVLNKDLYRLDLSSVVNKYIGETEKNLSQVLARAEELDVILLLDEGDALLTQRTEVRNSNDRYANLETNFLLQRLETFEGILLVTTNAGERIDSAFRRRLDVVVEFVPPDAAERWTIWQLHLPAAHTIDGLLLREVATRCTMTGGQIRNAALHATMLALEEGRTVSSAHLEAAVQREYRKGGAVCPLRRATAMSVG